ncbi:biotinidase [Caerostris darwini]|uniref:Biotinidase n=1 Tax=Caerostris darwini TaxID=1538125 RepID=A0AAV4U5H7_9ARAC|nr:biotinidase [Caerostris darwini]
MLPDVCSRTILNDSLDITIDYRCMEENLTHYTFKKLTEPEGRVEACNNGICCFVEYVADTMTENFYFGVFNVLQSGMRLAPRSVWDHHHHDNNRGIHVDAEQGEETLVVGMKGRCFDRDPPYIR